MSLRLAGLIALILLSGSANAWFLIFPLPNVAKPPELQSLIDALEKSAETRAVAFASEDKTFGGKRWVWGRYAGVVSQEEADQRALEMCRRGLAAAKAKTEGGQKLYDFGTKDCELHPFTPNDGPKNAEAKRKTEEAEAKRVLEIEEAKKAAAEQERKRIAAEEEQKRQAIEEEQKRLALVEEERKREEALRAEAAKVQVKGGAKSRATQRQSGSVSASAQAGGVDFNAEATKAARILGCQSPELKVTGAEAGSILYLSRCANSKTLSLKCDAAGLCLQQ